MLVWLSGKLLFSHCADDVGAVCVLNALVDNGEAEMLAVVHNTGLDTGVGAISVLNTYYGRGNVPIGECLLVRSLADKGHAQAHTKAHLPLASGENM